MDLGTVWYCLSIELGFVQSATVFYVQFLSPCILLQVHYLLVRSVRGAFKKVDFFQEVFIYL